MHVVVMYIPVMLEGALTTVKLTVLSSAIALLVGILGAIGRLYGGKIINAIVVVYVELIRGLPPILQLFLIFFGPKQFGINISPFLAAVIWMVVYGGGYAVEIFRAGIGGVPEGQREAAAALGLSYMTTMRKIILPQALVLMLPPLTSFMVLQLKNTTLVYFIGVADIMYEANNGFSYTQQPMIMFSMASVLYIIMNVGLARIGRRLELQAAAYR